MDGADGGEPGGNIRVAFLFRTGPRLSFVDRPGGDATTTRAASTARRGLSSPSPPAGSTRRTRPGRRRRKPLVGEFTFGGKKVFVVANHCSSKGGDQRVRPEPAADPGSEAKRHQQAQVVNDFVDEICANDPMPMSSCSVTSTTSSTPTADHR